MSTSMPISLEMKDMALKNVHPLAQENQYQRLNLLKIYKVFLLNQTNMPP